MAKSEGANQRREALIASRIRTNLEIWSNSIASARQGPKPISFRSMIQNQGALQHILVPEGIYRSAQNPEKVTVKVIEREFGTMDFFVVEPITHPPHSNYFNRLTLWEQARRGAHQSTQTASPENDPLDEMHIFFRDDLLVGKGKILSVNDRILLNVSVTEHGEALSIKYADRSDLRGQGIAKSFYDGLRAGAKDMGYRYLVGVNELPDSEAGSRGNAGFFIDKLKRYPIQRIKEQYRQKFLDYLNGDSFDKNSNAVLTIDFLYQEDIDEMVINPQIGPGINDAYSNR